MGPVFTEINIDAPREKIHDYLMDFATRKELYGDSIGDFRLLRLNSRGVGAGARFQFSRRDAWADSSIISADAGRISERGVGGSYNKTVTGTEWEFAENPNGVTTVRISYWTEPTGFAKVFDRFTGGAGWHSRRLKRAGARLRDLMEAGPSPVATPVAVAGGTRHPTGVR
ncbi:MAG: hypothetical protein M3Y45_06180 [Actinomycetota bacterium]|nr:hypothetical protein [Actinomycetota bacterium]